MIHAKIKDVDLCTLAMLSEIDFLPSDKILDLGCGYGVVEKKPAKKLSKK